MTKLTHTNQNGKINMVDTSDKQETKRIALSKGKIKVSQEAFKLIKENNIKKGDVISVAKIAGILGAKQTSNLIPLCHNILINKVEIHINLQEETHELEVQTLTKTVGTTGVEMESLVGTATALLTLYDMIKAVDKTAIITDIKLLKKSGGKSGEFNIEEV